MLLIWGQGPAEFETFWEWNLSHFVLFSILNYPNHSTQFPYKSWVLLFKLVFMCHLQILTVWQGIRLEFFRTIMHIMLYRYVVIEDWQSGVWPWRTNFVKSCHRHVASPIDPFMFGSMCTSRVQAEPAVPRWANMDGLVIHGVSVPHGVTISQNTLYLDKWYMKNSVLVI